MNHFESKLQQSCIRWFDLQYPKYKQLLFSVPNGGARSKSQGEILKREGVRAGVADLFFAYPWYEQKYDKHWHGLFIEMKVGKGKQTDAQLAFEKAVTEEQGYSYKVVRSLEEFQTLINNWLA